MIDYQMLVIFYLLVGVGLTIILYNWSDSEVHGRSFMQRLDLINVRFSLALVPSAGEIEVRYNATDFLYGIDLVKGIVYVDDGFNRISSYFSIDKNVKPRLDQEKSNLIIRGKNV